MVVRDRYLTKRTFYKGLTYYNCSYDNSLFRLYKRRSPKPIESEKSKRIRRRLYHFHFLDATDLIKNIPESCKKGWSILSYLTMMRNICKV